MSRKGLHFVGIGRGLASTWRNATATAWRALLSGLADRGHRVTFLEPYDADRAAHEGPTSPIWVRRIVWRDADELERALAVARSADVVIKASGVCPDDRWLDDRALSLRRPGNAVLCWDLGHGGKELVSGGLGRWDAVATAAADLSPWRRLGAREVISLPPAVDPSVHRPPRLIGEPGLVWFGAFCPVASDRITPWLDDTGALVAGAGWSEHAPRGARSIGHVPVREHGALLAGRAVLHLSRSRAGLPEVLPARLVEAAGCGGCLVSEPIPGLDTWFEPGAEILVVRDPEELRETLAALSPAQVRALGQAARARALAQHTNDRLAARLEALVLGFGQESAHDSGAARR